LPIKKKEVFKILFDRWAKDTKRDKDQVSEKYLSLIDFIKLMEMDVEKMNDITGAIRDASKVLTFNALYKIVFNNISFD